MKVWMAGLVAFLSFSFPFSNGLAHERMEHIKVPAEYTGKKNPYWTDLKAIIAGSRTYKEKCELCHGPEGKGDGILGRTLDPKPADFTQSRMMAETRDDYLFWRVSEGGGFPPFNSAMPAFKGVLNEEEIWQVLAYVHAFSHIKLLEHRPGEETPEGLPSMEERHDER